MSSDTSTFLDRVRTGLDEVRESNPYGLVGINVIVLLGAVLSAFPMYYMFVSSTFAPGSFFQFPPKLIPGANLVENYIMTLTETRFPRALLNSLIFAVGSTIGVLVVATTAGYSFAMYQYPGRKPLFYITLVALAIPFQLIAIPLFTLLVEINLVDTYIGAILPALVHPVAVVFMKQNIEQTIVEDLLNSARMDGASEFQIFFKIVLPLIKPALAALAILMFLRRMNVLFWPLVVFRSPEMAVATQFIANNRGIVVPTNWQIVMPASVMATIPVLLIFLFLQQYFIKGLLSGAVKE